MHYIRQIAREGFLKNCSKTLAGLYKRRQTKRTSKNSLEYRSITIPISRMDNTHYGEINYKEKSSCSKDFCRIVFEDNTDDESISIKTNKETLSMETYVRIE